jgi:hypothetical protein
VIAAVSTMFRVFSAAMASLRLTWTVTGTTRRVGQASIITGVAPVPARAARNSV